MKLLQTPFMKLAAVSAAMFFAAMISPAHAQTPPALSADTRFIHTQDGATEITVTATLPAAAAAETIFTLSAAGGVIGTDYNVSPVFDGATITVSTGETTGEATFTVTPIATGNGAVITLDAVVSGGATFTADMVGDATINIFPPPLTVSPETLATSGADTTATFMVQLREEPTADVTMNITIDPPEAGAVYDGLQPDGAALTTLTFTAASHATPRALILKAKGSTAGAYTVRMEVTNTGSQYDEQRTAIPGMNAFSNIINLSNAEVDELPAEAKSFAITATVEGGIGVPAECVITLAREAGAMNGYTALTPGTITIPMGMRTADSTGGSVTTAADSDTDTEEIFITGAATCGIGGAMTTVNPGKLSIIDRGALVLTTVDENGAATSTALTAIETNGAGSSAKFAVALMLDPGDPTSVSVTPTSSTPAANVSATALTFTGGVGGNWMTPQIITINGAGNAAGNYEIALEVGGGSTLYTAAQNESVSGANVLATTGTLSDARVFETPIGVKMFALTAMIDGAINSPEACEVMLTATNDTADSSDYSDLTLSTLTIAANTRAATTTDNMITTIADTDTDTETINVAGEATCGGVAVNFGTAVISIADTPGLNVTSVDENGMATATELTALATNGGGSTAQFAVALLSDPGADDVSVSVASSDAAHAAVSPAVLTFSGGGGNWETPQIVTVNAAGTTAGDYEITLTVSSDGDDYGADENETITAANALLPTGTLSMVNVSESPAGAKMFSVTATIDGGVNVADACTVTLSMTADGDAVDTEDYSDLTFADITISAGANSGASTTNTITTIADTDADTETITFTGGATCDSVVIAFTAGVVNISDAEPALVLSKTAVATAGDGSADDFSVALLTDPGADDVTVAISVAPPEAASVNPASLVFTSTDHMTAQSVSVSGLGTTAGDYMITLEVSSGGVYGTDENETITGANALSATGTLSNAQIIETPGAKMFEITATIDGGINAPVECTVTLNASGGDATAGTDYSALTLVDITIPADSRTATMSGNMITPMDDGDFDTETIIITGAGTCGGDSITFGGGDGSRGGVLSIIDTGLVLSKTEVTTNGAGSGDDFSVTLRADPGADDVTVSVMSDDEDHAIASPASLVFTGGDWQTPQMVSVAGAGNATGNYMINLEVASDSALYGEEQNESVSGANALAATGVLSDVRVVEMADAQMFEITATIDGGIDLAEACEITLTDAGGGSADADDFSALNFVMLTIPVGARTVTVAGHMITATEDADTGDETINIIGNGNCDGVDIVFGGGVENRGGVITIADPVTAGLELSKTMLETNGDGSSDEFSVKLLADPGADHVTVSVASSDETHATVSPAALTFTGGSGGDWETPQMVSVAGAGDATGTYMINLAVESDSTLYGEDENVSITGENVLATFGMLTDVSVDETPAGDKIFSITATIGGGINTPEACMVTLTGAGGGDQPADDPGDYTSLTFTTLTIPADSQTGTTDDNTIATVDDGDAETETILIIGTGTCGGVEITFGGENRGGVLSIVDPTATGLDLPDNLPTFTEGGDAVMFPVMLLSQPSSPVTVTLESDNPAVTLSPATLTFTPTDWNTPQMVTITPAATDNTISQPQNISITFTTTSDDANYADIEMPVSGQQTDGDMVASIGTLSQTSVNESPAGVKNFTLTATISGNIAPNANCTVMLSLDSTTPIPSGFKAAADGSDYEKLMLKPITIAAGSLRGSAEQTITTIADADADLEAILITGRATNCGGGSVAFAGGFVSIIDQSGGDTAAMLNSTVAPVVIQQSVAHGLAAIEARADSPNVNTSRFAFAGKTTTEAALLEHMKAMSAADDAGDVEYDWKNALGKSSALMPLNLNGGGGSFWINNAYREVDVENDGVIAEGDTTTISLGVDARLTRGMLAGLMLSFTDSEVKYSDESAAENTGRYMLTGASARPYFASSVGGTTVWGSAGYGEGEMEVIGAGGEDTADTVEVSYAIGIKQRLAGSGLYIKTDLASVTLDIEKGEFFIQEQSIDTRRVRMLLEARADLHRANGVISPAFEVGYRHDLIESDANIDADRAAADDTTGGAEAGVGMDFIDRTNGLTVSTKARVYDGSDYEEWGFSVTISKVTVANGLGLAFNLSPVYGDANSSVDSIFNAGFDETMSGGDAAVADADYTTRINGGMSYALRAPNARGVMTPYTKATFAADGTDNRHRLGLKWKPNSRFNVDIHGGENSADDVYGVVFNWDRKLIDFSLSGAHNEADAAGNEIKLTGTIDF